MSFYPCEQSHLSVSNLNWKTVKIGWLASYKNMLKCSFLATKTQWVLVIRQIWGYQRYWCTDYPRCFLGWSKTELRYTIEHAMWAVFFVFHCFTSAPKTFDMERRKSSDWWMNVVVLWIVSFHNGGFPIWFFDRMGLRHRMSSMEIFRETCCVCHGLLQASCIWQHDESSQIGLLFAIPGWWDIQNRTHKCSVV